MPTRSHDWKQSDRSANREEREEITDFHEIGTAEEEKQSFSENIGKSEKMRAVIVLVQRKNVYTRDDIFQMQHHDPLLCRVIARLRADRKRHTTLPNFCRTVAYSISPLTGLLMYSSRRNPLRRIVVPPTLRMRIFHNVHHELAHTAHPKTYQAMAERYFWWGMKRDVENFVKECAVCQVCKASQPKRAGHL
jgi:hypothetical protein